MAQTTTGDLADLTRAARRLAAWREVSATPETRLGSRCPFFERCFRHRHATACAGRQLVIVNHHLSLPISRCGRPGPKRRSAAVRGSDSSTSAPDRGDRTEFFGSTCRRSGFRVARDLERAYGLDGAAAHSAAARLLGRRTRWAMPCAITCRCRGRAPTRCACRPRGHVGGARLARYTSWTALLDEGSRPGWRSMARPCAKARNGAELAGLAGARPCYATRWARWSIAVSAACALGRRHRAQRQPACVAIDVGPALARASSR